MSLAVAALASFPIRGAQPQSLDVTLTPYLAEFGLPALAAAVVQNGSIVAARAVGTRRAGGEIPVSIQDRSISVRTAKPLRRYLQGNLSKPASLAGTQRRLIRFPN